MPDDYDYDGERIDDPLMAKLGHSEGGGQMEPPKLRGMAKRTIFTLLITFGFFNVYAMRVNLSEAVNPMQLQYQWTDAAEGYVLSSFFWVRLNRCLRCCCRFHCSD